jgi:hypothetical protein
MRKAEDMLVTIAEQTLGMSTVVVKLQYCRWMNFSMENFGKQLGIAAHNMEPGWRASISPTQWWAENDHIQCMSDLIKRIARFLLGIPPTVIVCLGSATGVPSSTSGRTSGHQN